MYPFFVMLYFVVLNKFLFEIVPQSPVNFIFFRFENYSFELACVFVCRQSSFAHVDRVVLFVVVFFFVLLLFLFAFFIHGGGELISLLSPCHVCYHF